MREPDQEQPELDDDRLVEAELGVDPRDVGIVRPLAEESAAVGSPGSNRTSTNATMVIKNSVGTS